jgi:hypothetical protein
MVDSFINDEFVTLLSLNGLEQKFRQYIDWTLYVGNENHSYILYSL